MRHLFVTNDFPPKTGGIESYLATLCSGFDPADVTVIAPARAGHVETDASLPYRVVRLPGNYLRAKRSVGTRIADVAVQRDADVVHFLHALPLGRLAAGVRAATGLPVTVFAHGSEVFVPARAPFVKRVVRNVLSGADLVLAVSGYTADAVARFTKGQARVQLLQPAVDVERFSLAASGSRMRDRLGVGSRFVVLFVGRLVKRKGADILIRAIAGMPRAAAVIAGAGPEEAALKRLAEELEVSRRVVFPGAVPDAQLPQLYAAADVFCMPCVQRFGGLDTEGFGIVYLEAAACGLPCVAGACGGSAEAVRDGVTGIVLHETTPASLTATLKRLEKDESLRIVMGAAGRERAERDFAPGVMAARLEAYLAEVLNARATTAS